MPEAIVWRPIYNCFRLVCLDRKVVSLFESAEHVTRAIPPHSRTLTTAQKVFSKLVTRAVRFTKRASSSTKGAECRVPLSPYQARGSDTTATIVTAVQKLAFNSSEEEHEPFTFVWDLDTEGKLVVGNGSDEKPFLVGFSTKALLCQASQEPAIFILHVDATYKANQVGYPVVVIGITDAARTFHLSALFVISQHQEGHHAKAFAALCWIYGNVLGEPLRISFLMGDADAAQYNAAAAVCGSDGKYVHLMCLYHVLAKIIDRLKGLPYEVRDFLLRDIYDLHHSRSADGFATVSKATETRWLKLPMLEAFHRYFKRVWLNDRFCHWQCYSTPIAFAPTNNPVGQFNRALKHDYTAHRLLKIGELIQQLAACCHQRAIDLRPFALTTVASKELFARVKALRSQQLLRAPRMSLDFHMVDSSTDVLHVLYTAPERAYSPATNSFQEAL